MLAAVRNQALCRLLPMNPDRLTNNLVHSLASSAAENLRLRQSQFVG